MTDFRALCAEGVAFIWSATDPDDLSINADEWAEKVNAALIETDEELAKLFAEVYRSGKGERWRAYIRVLLARWGSDQGKIRSGSGSPLVERVADVIAGETTSAGIVNDRPARAAILQVAKWLREQGTPASDWAIHLEQQATSLSRPGATS